MHAALEVALGSYHCFIIKPKGLINQSDSAHSQCQDCGPQAYTKDTNWNTSRSKVTFTLKIMFGYNEISRKTENES